MTDFSDTPTRETLPMGTLIGPTEPTHPPAARCADPLCLWCEAWNWWAGWPHPPIDETCSRRVDEQHPPMSGTSCEHWWWACQWPERVFVPGRTGFAMSCRECVLALGAVAVNRPQENVLFYEQPGFDLPVTLVPCADAYEQLREMHELPVLRYPEPSEL